MTHIRAEDCARPTTDLTGHRALMAAVLTQIIKDALMIPKTAEDRRERDLSQRMIRGCTRWFRQICDFAGVDPEAVRDRFLAGEIAPPAQNIAVRHNRRKAPGTPEKSPASGQVASLRTHVAKTKGSPSAVKSGAVATVTKMGMVAE